MKKKTSVLLITLLFSVNALSQKAQNNPVDAVKDFWNLVLTSDLNEVRRISHDAQFQSEIESIKNKEIAITDIVDVEITSEIARIEVDAKDKQGVESTFSFQLIKRESSGRWEIIDMFRKLVKSSPLKRLNRIEPTNFPRNFQTNCIKCG